MPVRGQVDQFMQQMILRQRISGAWLWRPWHAKKRSLGFFSWRAVVFKLCNITPESRRTLPSGSIQSVLGTPSWFATCLHEALSLLTLSASWTKSLEPLLNSGVWHGS
jgi:hypothetical protein